MTYDEDRISDQIDGGIHKQQAEDMKVSTAKEFYNHRHGGGHTSNPAFVTIDFAKAYATMVVDSMTDDEIRERLFNIKRTTVSNRTIQGAKWYKRELKKRIK